ncbi:MAG: cbb3-type cytochrome c oxidase subunit I [Gammaproteobacteria bacterium]|nr:cbb3-type cytochrome c oxidase subunit I [Gammaproteobacteria bacterium]
MSSHRGIPVVNQAERSPPGHEAQAARFTLGWIWLGVYALVAAGLLALLLALSRTPIIQDLVPGKEFFRVALVAHVDLTVLVWFVAGAGILWSMHGAARYPRWSLTAFISAVSGTVMISIAPFIGTPQPLMNNYVPVLQHPWFYAGLIAVALGLVIQACVCLRANGLRLRGDDNDAVLRFALVMAALAALVAVASVALSLARLPASVSGEFYFELLFWGGGHVLQFMHTVLMLVAFVMLSSATGSSLPGNPRLHTALFALVVAPLLAVPLLYRFPIESREHILGFTTLMRYGGMASVPLLLLVIAGLGRRVTLSASERPLRAALICSLSLFAGGGIMGFMIRGSNTVIPAHYHGSIVGVTLAYMGVVYLLLPRLGHPLTMPRTAFWQPYVYGIGQVMHVTALAWTGGHGVQRKTAGSAQGLDSIQEIVGMGLMGLGGLIAVIGGLMFLVVVIAALRARVAQPVSGFSIPPAPH